MSDVTRTSLKKQPEGMKAGNIIVVRPSKLAEEGRTGVVASGILEKIEPNKFNEGKNDYFIRSATGDLYILNDTATLKEQLTQDGVLGMNIEVVYNGKKKGKKSKKEFHDFEVFSVSK